jgi:hypothetical protein
LFRNRFAIALPSLRNRFVIALPSLRNRFVIALQSLRKRFAIALQSLLVFLRTYSDSHFHTLMPYHILTFLPLKPKVVSVLLEAFPCSAPAGSGPGLMPVYMVSPSSNGAAAASAAAATDSPSSFGGVGTTMHASSGGGSGSGSGSGSGNGSSQPWYSSNGIGNGGNGGSGVGGVGGVGLTGFSPMTDYLNSTSKAVALAPPSPFQNLNSCNDNDSESSKAAAREVIARRASEEQHIAGLKAIERMHTSAKLLLLLLKHRGAHMRNLIDILVMKLCSAVASVPLAIAVIFEQVCGEFILYF